MNGERDRDTSLLKAIVLALDSKQVACEFETAPEGNQAEFRSALIIAVKRFSVNGETKPVNGNYPIYDARSVIARQYRNGRFLDFSGVNFEDLSPRQKTIAKLYSLNLRAYGEDAIAHLCPSQWLMQALTVYGVFVGCRDKVEPQMVNTISKLSRIIESGSNIYPRNPQACSHVTPVKRRAVRSLINRWKALEG